MKFNSLIPELTVFDINRTKQFYIQKLGFHLEYEREEEKFIFLSYEGSQLMFEQIHEDGWNVGCLAYPLGRGINFSIQISDMERFYNRVKQANLTIYRDLVTNDYVANGEIIHQKEFLIQDPDGYLLRFTS